MVKIAVLASGRGSNFQAIIDSIENGYIKNAGLDILITDNKEAFAIKRAEKHGIDSVCLDPAKSGSKDEYFAGIAEMLSVRGIGLIALAGFMRIVRRPLINVFRNKIINIHPALLPAFPGLHGQRQALDYGVKLAGCTVHFVDEGMDTGPIIIQAAVPVFSDDSESSLSERILGYEHRIYPYAIRLFVEGRIEIMGRKVVIRDEEKELSNIMNPPPDVK
ncbi:phosphoribosylglycinamide formyltransferase [bacterium BMS3Abin07]|nr:phosphoribosylglycinamide formyltransferase [bacterium BMS3Abin07]HDL19744.1 phosphoribosylglycinamide formyltransferase [Nitrospirota bacterium]HDO21729.1 phosphoribosylglycinamide formyltransferase [Nitrospirota bacterium]HDZ87499.1 phosphoribosylglycinamide formyltransferase [Nitrospirota bacterium]